VNLKYAALTLVAVVASPLVATGIAHAATPKPNTIVNCAGKQVTKPANIVLTCADAGVALTKITWTSWTLNSAKGKGMLTWNSCLPTSCAAGVVVNYPADITLGGLASGPGMNAFSKVSVTFPKGGPAALESGTYTLNNSPR